MSKQGFAVVEQDMASFTGFLPYHSVDPSGNVVLMTDSAGGAPEWVGIVWKLTPADTEILSPDMLGVLGSRLERLIEALPEETAAQVILRTRRDIREDLDGWLKATRSQSTILQELAASRARALSRLSVIEEQTTFTSRTIEVLFSIARKGHWPACETGPLDLLGAACSGGDDSLSPLARKVEAAYIKEREDLLATAATLEALFAQSRIGAERLSEEPLARMLYERLNPRRGRTQTVWTTSPGTLMRERLTDSVVEGDTNQGLVSIEGVHHAVVSVIGLPPATAAGMLSRPSKDPKEPSLLDMAMEMDLVVDLWVGDQDELRDRQSARRRLATNQSQNIHQSPSLNPLREELFELEQELARGARIVSCRIHALPRAENPKTAIGEAQKIVTRLANFGMRAIIEYDLAPTFWLQALPLAYRPGNDQALRRARSMLAGNAAHLLPVYGGFRGTPRATQMLLSRSGQTVPLSFFTNSGSPHAIITGQSGSGKSFVANDLICQALRTGARVFVLDRGRSYQKLAETVGGAHVDYDIQPRRINPCGMAPADGSCPEDVQSFLTDWLTEVCTQGKGDLAVDQQNLLGQAVRKAFQRRTGQEVFVSHIQQALEEEAKEDADSRKLARCLMNFKQGGAYGNLFDGAGEIDFDNPLVVIDLGEYAKKQAVGSVLLMALVQSLRRICDRFPHEEKYLLIDEGWTLLKTSATARFLEDAARTFRKIRCSLVMLSQQLSDFAGSLGQAILDQAKTRIYLKHDHRAIESASQIMGLSDREVDLYKSVDTKTGLYSEMFLQTPYGSGVARLAPDSLSYWIATTDPPDRELLDQLRSKYVSDGLGDREALEKALLEASERFPAGAKAGERKPV
jgi:type-IV secretion system protein TraC